MNVSQEHHEELGRSPYCRVLHTLLLLASTDLRRPAMGVRFRNVQSSFVFTRNRGISQFMDTSGDQSRRLYSYLILVLQYVVPLTVLIITYTFIGMKMWNSRIPGPTSSTTKKVVMERHESVKKLRKYSISLDPVDEYHYASEGTEG
ncbi:hypothetical protein TELCIR_11914, partial [Teladorsagia circumcincta]